MFVGICSLDIVITDSHSLKAKRQIIRKVKDRVKNRFNVSIAEVEHLDSWRRCTLGIACVSRDRGHVDSQLSSVLNFIEGMGVAVVENIRTEIL